MRVALVTGAARGIGAATVHALCERGYAVAAVDVCAGEDTPSGVAYPLATRSDLREVADRHPDHVLPVEADVRDAQALRNAVALTLDRFGRLDAAVAGAGVVVGGQPAWLLDADSLRTLLDVNVVGVWNTAAAVLPHMLAGPEPAQCRFVAVASTAGERGMFGLTGYGASKHAVIGIVRGLAADLVGTGVTAVAVAPGSTRTPILDATADLYGTSVDELAQHQHLRRLIEPGEVAATIAMCCAPEGAVLNGSVVHAAGGFTG
jgi:SDR family mycofactocin-dependent oxidoreductase